MLPILNNLGSITFHSVMGVETADSNKSLPGKKLKPCCACPETRKQRDACIVEKGEENCVDLIEAHKACMRNMGFSI